jgi:hypothetical protein
LPPDDRIGCLGQPDVKYVLGLVSLRRQPTANAGGSCASTMKRTTRSEARDGRSGGPRTRARR